MIQPIVEDSTLRKLQVRTPDGWRYVFCHNNGRIVTTDQKSKALPSRAFWADDDLRFFQSKFAEREFRLF